MQIANMPVYLPWSVSCILQGFPPQKLHALIIPGYTVLYLVPLITGFPVITSGLRVMRSSNLSVLMWGDEKLLFQATF
jgi:hypothetical protein